MLYPEGDGKFDYARKLALALCYVGLSTHSSVKTAAFSDLETSGSLTDTSFLNGPPSSRNGAGSSPSASTCSASSRGGTDFVGYLQRYTSLTRGHRGVFIILSISSSSRRAGAG